jgi:hypothetical protein
MKKVFITGPVSERDIQQLEEFEHVREKILEMGDYDVTTVIDDLINGNHRQDAEFFKRHVMKRAKDLTQSNILVFLEGSVDDPIADAEMWLCKHFYDIPVYSAVEFLKQKSNDDTNSSSNTSQRQPATI